MKLNRTTGSALLIAGTCIGAGMLALPVATASSGFFFSVIILLICWAAMFLAGLYVLEVNLCLKLESNFISMAKVTLGRWGEIVAWLTYILLLYSLMAAYLTAGGGVVVNAIDSVFAHHFQSWTGSIVWVLVAGVILYLGVYLVDYCNRVLIIGLIIAYVLLVTFASPKIQLHNFVQGHPQYLLAALPIIITAFGFHVIIPSLRVYLQSNVKKLIKVIFYGSLIPLIVYILWELVIFGTIPADGKHGLIAIYQSGQPATTLAESLSLILKSDWIIVAARFFIFFAIASSFLGIATSLFDFLSDGFQIKKTPFGKIMILLLMFVPPFIYAHFYPKGFILALSYAGIFVAILHGILPACMVFAARKKQLVDQYRSPGGNVGLIALITFSALIIIAQVVLNIGWISSVK